MLDHVSIQCARHGVQRFVRSTTRSSRRLAGLRIMEFGGLSLRHALPADFWIGAQATGDGFRESHIAFAAPDRAAVRAFLRSRRRRRRPVSCTMPRYGRSNHDNY